MWKNPNAFPDGLPYHLDELTSVHSNDLGNVFINTTFIDDDGHFSKDVPMHDDGEYDPLLYILEIFT